LRGSEEARGGLLRTCIQYCLPNPCGDNLEDAEFCADTLKTRQRVDAAAEECGILRIVAEDVGKVRSCADRRHKGRQARETKTGVGMNDAQILGDVRDGDESQQETRRGCQARS
jgi:hypothetical protein